jgi:hypothetical protein
MFGWSLFWLLAIFVFPDKDLVVIFGFFQFIFLVYYCFTSFGLRGFFASPVPYVISSSIWFFYIDLALGNFVADALFVSWSAFYVSFFLAISLFVYSVIPARRLMRLRPNKEPISSGISIGLLKWPFFLIPLLVQFCISLQINVNQLLLLFGGRGSGYGFFGTPDIPFAVANLLSPLMFCFFLSPVIALADNLSPGKLGLQRSFFNQIIIFVPLVAAFSTGTRNIFLSSLIPLLACLVSNTPKLHSKLIIAGLSVFIIPYLFQFMVTYRGFLDPTTMNFRLVQGEIGGSNVLSAHRDNNIDVFASAIRSRSHFDLPSDYNEIIVSTLQFVPRILFPWKPESNKISYADNGAPVIDQGYLSFYIGSNVTASLTLTLPGDFFYADGFWALLIGAVFYGTFIYLADFLLVRLSIDLDKVSFSAIAPYFGFLLLTSFRAYSIIFYGLTPLLILVPAFTFLKSKRGGFRGLI